MRAVKNNLPTPSENVEESDGPRSIRAVNDSPVTLVVGGQGKVAPVGVVLGRLSASALKLPAVFSLNNLFESPEDRPRCHCLVELSKRNSSNTKSIGVAME
jgi:hypothetical protein